MARFTVSERNQYLTDSTLTNAGTTGPELAASRIEADRHLPCVSPAAGTMFIMGSNPATHFEMELLELGQAGDGSTTKGLNIDGVDTGYQLVPIVTGNSTASGWPNPSGMAIESDDFDGSPEVFLGTGPTENMLGVSYSGNWKVVASCKPAPTGGNQNNRECEIDLVVFDSSGIPLRIVGFTASANQATNGRVFSMATPSVTLNSNTIQTGEYIGLVIRKFLGESPTTVKFSKGFIQITLESLAQ